MKPSWCACQISETQCGAVRVMEPSVNMTRTSLSYISIVFFTIVLRCESLSDICNIHKKAIQKKTCSQRSSCRFSCTFCAYFVNLYNKPLVWKSCTDHDYKGWKTSSIVSYQMKAECECSAFFPVSKQLVWLVLFTDFPSDPRPFPISAIRYARYTTTWEISPICLA